ncbi:hypothetical protein PG996_009526 [Apiospora saccharicola]|uniref:Uncharacterized protein n=1 Tax=Apiospora saccharicola TaxID=335842 RepID=A0ABR1UL03_9PEZI
MTWIASFSRRRRLAFSSGVSGAGESSSELSLEDSSSLSDELLDALLDSDADRSSWADFGVAMPESTDSLPDALLDALSLSELDGDNDRDLAFELDSSELVPDVDADLDRTRELCPRRWALGLCAIGSLTSRRDAATGSRWWPRERGRDSRARMFSGALLRGRLKPAGSKGFLSALCISSRNRGGGG